MTPDPRIGTTLGSFRIEAKIGEGGMGAVYRAVHQRLGRPAALKILPANLLEDDEPYLERFFAEARAAARVDHPNVVRVYDAEEVEGVHYIAMEFVAGVDLRGLLKKRCPLEEAESLAFVLQAARGLQAAARENIVHRDIKPANLMLTDQGRVKVADFGLAKNLDAASGLTRTGQIMGTPAYMSPEQADGAKTDIRSDIYSLGATLFEMVTGRRPFTAESTLALLRKISDAPLPDPVRFRPDLSVAAARVLRRMMEKRPADRYQDYGTLIEDLEAAGARADGAAGSLDGPAGALSSLFVLVEETLLELRADTGETASLRDVADPALPDTAQRTADTVPWPPPGQRPAPSDPAAPPPPRPLPPLVWIGVTALVLIGVTVLLQQLGFFQRRVVAPPSPAAGGPSPSAPAGTAPGTGKAEPFPDLVSRARALGGSKKTADLEASLVLWKEAVDRASTPKEGEVARTGARRASAELERRKEEEERARKTVEARTCLTTAREEAAMRNYGRAAELYRKALALDPQLLEARVELDRLQRDLDRREEEVAEARRRLRDLMHEQGRKRVEVARLRSLAEKNVVPKSRYQAAQAELESLQRRVLEAQLRINRLTKKRKKR